MMCSVGFNKGRIVKKGAGSVRVRVGPFAARAPPASVEAAVVPASVRAAARDRGGLELGAFARACSVRCPCVRPLSVRRFPRHACGLSALGCALRGEGPRWRVRSS
eukprot:122578-Pleurochrysis_carterae.AAC.1